MDQEIEKNCRYSNLIDYRSCSKRKQTRIMNRNEKFGFLGVITFLWTVLFAIGAMHRPGDGTGLAANGLVVALMTAMYFHSLLDEHLRPRRLATDIRRFPHGCGSSDDAIALANPDVLKLAAKRRCQSEDSFETNEALRQSEARTEWAVISAIYGIFGLVLSGLVWRIVYEFTAEYVPLTWAERVAESEQTESFILHLLGYGSLAGIVITVLGLCVYAVTSSRKARAEEEKREKALAALERLPTGYRIAAVQPDYTEESLECRLARIPHHLRSPDIEDYIASVDPAEPGYKAYPTRACGT